MSKKNLIKFTIYRIPVLRYFYFKWLRFKAKIQGRWVHIPPRGYRDEVPINSAIHYLNRDGKGGLIELKGIYHISDSIIVENNTTIVGQKHTLIIKEP